MEKVKVKLDGNEYEVPKEAIEIEDHSIIDNGTLDKFKNRVIETELVRYGTSRNFDKDFTRSIVNTRPVIVHDYGDRFKVDNEGSVYMVNSEGDYVTDEDGERISPSKYFDKNPQLVSKLKRGIHAFQHS